MAGGADTDENEKVTGWIGVADVGPSLAPLYICSLPWSFACVLFHQPISLFRSFSLTQSAVFDSFDPSSLSLLWQEPWQADAEIKATSCPCCCVDKVGKKLCTFLLFFNRWLITPFSSTSSPLLAPVPFFLFLLVHQINSSQVSGFALCTIHWGVGQCGGKLPKTGTYLLFFFWAIPSPLALWSKCSFYSWLNTAWSKPKQRAVYMEPRDIWPLRTSAFTTSL